MSQPDTTLSIGMPVYNGERYLKEAIDSLLSQTFSEFELLISDNASTDGTEKICREYAEKDKRIRYIRQAQNLGAIPNFNLVLKESSGNFFMWAAADDLWDKSWIEVLYPIAKEFNCLSFGKIKHIGPHGRIISHPANNRPFSYTGNKLARRIKYFAEPSYYGKANPVNGIYPKKILMKIFHRYPLTSTYGTDTLLLYSLLSEAEIRSGGNVFLYKRIHSANEGGGLLHESSSNTAVKKVQKAGRHLNAWLKMLYNDYAARSTKIEKTIQIISLPYIISKYVLGLARIKFEKQNTIEQGELLS